MDSGRFTALVLIIVILIGGTFYYAYSGIQDLRAQTAEIQAAASAARTMATDADTKVNQAKAAADNATATLTKLGPIDQLAKQASDSAAAAAKSAEEAKAAAGTAKPAARRR